MPDNVDRHFPFDIENGDPEYRERGMEDESINITSTDG